MLSDLTSVVLSRIYWRSVKVIGKEWLQITNCGFGSRMYSEMLGLNASKSGIRHEGVSTANPVGFTSMLAEPLSHFGARERANLERNLAGLTTAD